MNHDTLKKIIRYGTYAPSGDNSQPWKFIINKNDNILLYNLPLRDNPVLNIHQSGSLLSHGAVIFNIRVVVEILGYELIVNYFPDNKDENLVAELSFVKKTLNFDNHSFFGKEWLSYIEKRSTNRRIYKKALNINILSRLKNGLDNQNCKIEFFTNEEDKNIIANEINLSEEIILGTQELHKLLYKDIVWTQKEELRKKHGLFVKTLEFNPVQVFIFWLCRKWSNISFFNKIGFAHFIAVQNAKIYKSSGVLGFIHISNTDKINYVQAGESMQYIWLKATSLGLGFQPITGLFFLRERIKNLDEDPILTKNSIKKIKKTYNILKDFIKLPDDRTILISFRIGESKKTSARSSRLEPNIILE